MLKEERQLAILNEVELHNRILLTDIAEKLNVSIDTARRDVKELDAVNKLRKVHGGAISLGFTGCKYVCHERRFGKSERRRLSCYVCF